MTTARTKPRFAEFFAGIGLVRMGLEVAGWSLAYANDLDAAKRAMYDDHFGDADDHFELRDVHTVDGADLPAVDLATASFPCTDLSLAGARHGLKGKHSSAFWGFLRVLKGMSPRPRLIMLENVVGFLTSHGGSDFREALLAINALGYAVDAFVLDAKSFVPQSRPRLFVIGSSIPPLVPAPLHAGALRPAPLVRFIEANPQIRWRHHTLPDPPRRSAATLADIVEQLPASSPRWWNSARTTYLYNQFSPKHRALADAMIAKRRSSYATVFRRVRLQPDGVKRSMAELRTDGLAGCLRTPKGGSARQILVQAGNGKFAVRLLTPRECARLMGADPFTMSAPDTAAYFGFGDAVCVPAITWIAKHCLNPLLASASPRIRERRALTPR